MTTEYRLTRLDPTTVKIAKFGDESGDQPENIYYVSQDRRGDQLCSCPNRRRGKHVNDKHGRMVADWIARGEPIGFYQLGDDFHELSFTEQPHLANDPFESDDERLQELADGAHDDWIAERDSFPDDEAPPNGNLDGDDEDEHR